MRLSSNQQRELRRVLGVVLASVRGKDVRRKKLITTVRRDNWVLLLHGVDIQYQSVHVRTNADEVMIMKVQAHAPHACVSTTLGH